MARCAITQLSVSNAPNLDGDSPDNGYEAIWKADSQRIY